MEKSRERSSPLSLDLPSSLAAGSAISGPVFGHLRPPNTLSNSSLQPPPSLSTSTYTPGISPLPNTSTPFIFSSFVDDRSATASPLSSSSSSVGCSSGATSSSVGSLFAGLRPTPFSPPPFVFGLNLSSPPCSIYKSILPSVAALAPHPVAATPPPQFTFSGGSSSSQGTPCPSSARGDGCGQWTGVQSNHCPALSISQATAVPAATKDSPSCYSSPPNPLSFPSCPLANSDSIFKFGSLPFPQVSPPIQPPTSSFPQQSNTPSSCHPNSPSPSLKDLPTPRSESHSPQSKEKPSTAKPTPSSRPLRRHPPPPHGGKGILPTPPLYFPFIPVVPCQFLNLAGLPIYILMVCPSPLGPLPVFHHPPRRTKARRSSSVRSKHKQPETPSSASPTAENIPSTSVHTSAAAPPNQPPSSAEVAPTSAPQCHPITTPTPSQVTVPHKNAATHVKSAARPHAIPPASRVLEGSKSKTQPDTSRSHRRCPRKELLFAMRD